MEDDTHDSTTTPAAAASAPAAAAAAPAQQQAKKKKKKSKKGAAGVGASSSSGGVDMSDVDDPKEAEARAWLQSVTEDELLNPRLRDPSHIAALGAQFRAAQPFPHLAVPDLFDASFLRTLENELRGVEYYTKSSDLFEFAQSGDLKGVHSPLVAKLKSVLYGAKFRAILQQITGIEIGQLAETVDMSANVYGDTNTLLCHDDELHGRRIAYILYFVPSDWSAADGGSLDLFDTDGEGQPRDIVKSLVPAWNTFTFFEVSPVSFHQVSEVTVGADAFDEITGTNRVRMSVSGWYHGAPIVRPAPAVPTPLPVVPLADDTQFALADWLAPEYLKQKNISKIAAQFGEESSIELASFLAKDKYAALMRALADAPEADWKKQGPANKQCFSAFDKIAPVKNSAAATAAASSAAAASSSAAAASATASASSGSSSSAAFLSALHSFLGSSVFGSYLQQLTGLEYVSAAGCVRRFTAGCYTLAHSDSEERFEEAVDVTLCCLRPSAGAGIAAKKGKDRWDAAKVGGSTHYIEEGEQDELMSLAPKENTLAIVYRAGVPAGPEREEARAAGRAGVIRFVKYINHHANQPRYDFDFVFRVQPSEDDDDEDEDEEEEEEEEVAPPPKKAAKNGKK